MKPIIPLCIVMAASLMAVPVICAAEKTEVPVSVAQSHASIEAYSNAIISLKDATTGRLYYVESNGRRLVAFGKDGDVRWIVDVMEATNVTPKVGAPVIRHLRMQDGRLLVTFGKDDHAEVEITNGTTKYLGADATSSPAAVGCGKETDPIDRLVEKLSASHGLWLNGVYQPIRVPGTTPIDDVVSKAIDKQYPGYKIMKTRQVQVQGKLPDVYTAVVIHTQAGEKIVLLQYDPRMNGWWNRVYDPLPAPDKTIIDPKSGRYAQVDPQQEVVSLHEKDGKTLWSTNVIEAVRKYVGSRTNEFPRITDRKIESVQLHKGDLWVHLGRGYAILDVKTGKFQGIASN